MIPLSTLLIATAAITFVVIAVSFAIYSIWTMRDSNNRVDAHQANQRWIIEMANKTYLESNKEAKQAATYETKVTRETHYRRNS